ncbi:uncharacterized protein CLUP02_01767 [Colletotrichum lupini]|uniref:Uncharacterized protein n=1 Tax=Colletotrichum lupini TaxID=145971 RepID=A0A9Q8W9H2_9PEZI|nr:uncharacterized protein CLUP02_01767 [Colletotrichum lupini]UQC75114.1 hypothetical protein CLUP02_01767 [Colletotrichum lupini]
MAGWAVSGFQQQSPKRGDNKLVTTVADRQAIRDQPTERERKAQRPAKQQNSERHGAHQDNEAKGKAAGTGRCTDSTDTDQLQRFSANPRLDLSTNFNPKLDMIGDLLFPSSASGGLPSNPTDKAMRLLLLATRMLGSTGHQPSTFPQTLPVSIRVASWGNICSKPYCERGDSSRDSPNNFLSQYAYPWTISDQQKQAPCIVCIAPARGHCSSCVLSCHVMASRGTHADGGRGGLRTASPSHIRTASSCVDRAPTTYGSSMTDLRNCQRDSILLESSRNRRKEAPNIPVPPPPRISLTSLHSTQLIVFDSTLMKTWGSSGCFITIPDCRILSLASQFDRAWHATYIGANICGFSRGWQAVEKGKSKHYLSPTLEPANSVSARLPNIGALSRLYHGTGDASWCHTQPKIKESLTLRPTMII